MKIEITVNGKTIEAEVNEEDLKELTKEEKEVPDVLWRAKKCGKYFYIYANGLIGTSEEDGHKQDNGFWELGNYYRTVEEAEKEIEKRKAIMRIRRYSAEKWGEFVPDWSDHNQVKFYICYNHDQKSFYGDYNCLIQKLSFIHFEKIGHRDEIIKKFDSDLKLIFNIK